MPLSALAELVANRAISNPALTGLSRIAEPTADHPTAQEPQDPLLGSASSSASGTPVAELHSDERRMRATDHGNHKVNFG